MIEQLSLTTIFLITTVILIIAINVAKLNGKVKGIWSLLSLSVLVTLVFLFATIPFIISCPFFWTYKHLVKWYLKIKYGSQFIGLIEGCDVTYASNDKRDSIVTVLFMYEVNSEKTATDVFESLKRVVNKHYIKNKNKLSRLHCVLCNCSGYTYMKKNNVTIDECFRKMKTIDGKEEITKEELMELIDEYKDGGFLQNDQLLWDYVVGSQPVEWKSKDGVKYYPVLFRFHHGISDGFSFVQFIFGVTADKSNNSIINRASYISKTKDTSSIIIVTQNIMISLYSIIYNPTTLIMENLIKSKEHNILQGVKLNKVSVYRAKVDNGDYFKKIKYIKSCIRGVTFSDILFAAVSFSFYEYLKKDSRTKPKYLHIGVPFLQKAMYLTQLPVGGLSIDDIDLVNFFDLLYLKLPIELDNDDLPLYGRLKATQKQTQKMAQSTASRVLHFATHIILQILPRKMSTYITNMMKLNAIVSIFPVSEKVTTGNGELDIHNVIPWIPRMNGIGCSLVIVTYDNKLQMSLNIDSAFISKEDSQRILDGIFEYLSLLEKEINLNNLNCL